MQANKLLPLIFEIVTRPTFSTKQFQYFVWIKILIYFAISIKLTRQWRNYLWSDIARDTESNWNIIDIYDFILLVFFFWELEKT